MSKGQGRRPRRAGAKAKHPLSRKTKEVPEARLRLIVGADADREEKSFSAPEPEARGGFSRAGVREVVYAYSAKEAAKNRAATAAKSKPDRPR